MQSAADNKRGHAKAYKPRLQLTNSLPVAAALWMAFYITFFIVAGHTSALP
jgi:hypothetical protein